MLCTIKKSTNPYKKKKILLGRFLQHFNRLVPVRRLLELFGVRGNSEYSSFHATTLLQRKTELPSSAPSAKSTTRTPSSEELPAFRSSPCFQLCTNLMNKLMLREYMNITQSRSAQCHNHSVHKADKWGVGNSIDHK